MIDQLLRRIGIDSRDAGLAAVHRAYLEHVTYEDIAVQLGETGPLDEQVLARRVLSGRGGYCFELNTVLAYLLRGLGFGVEYHQAVVGGEGPTNHMVLVVDGEWMADAGLGQGFMEPLPLREGRHAGQGPFSWTLEREPAGTWWMGQHEWGSITGFRMQAEPSERAAFEPHHRRLATDPASSFVQTFVVQRPTDDRILSLRARTYSEDGPSAGVRRVLDRGGFEAALGELGVTVDAGRVERLWALASAQHEAFQARAAATP